MSRYTPPRPRRPFTDDRPLAERAADRTRADAMRASTGCARRHELTSPARVALRSGDVVCLPCAVDLDPMLWNSAVRMEPTTPENRPGRLDR